MKLDKFENKINPLDEIKIRAAKKEIFGNMMLAVEKIIPDPNQPRKNFDNLDNIIESVREQGIINPLTVRQKGAEFELISGECRLRAAKIIGLKEVPVICRDVTDEEKLLIQIIENLQRNDLTPMELAESYKRLQDEYKLSGRDIAKKIGKSHEHVNQILKLLGLTGGIKEKVASGLPPSKALEISKLDKKTQKEVLKNPEKYSRDEIRNLKTKSKDTDKIQISKNQEPEDDDQTQIPEDQEPETEEQAAPQEPETENREPAHGDSGIAEDGHSYPLGIPSDYPFGETTKTAIDDFYKDGASQETNNIEERNRQVEELEGLVGQINKKAGRTFYISINYSPYAKNKPEIIISADANVLLNIVSKL